MLSGIFIIWKALWIARLKIHQPYRFHQLKIYAKTEKVYCFNCLLLKYAMVKTVYCFNWLPRTFTGSSQRGFPWNSLKSESIEILHLSALKEPVQIDYKKAYSVMEQEWISIFCWHICVKYLNPLRSTRLFLYYVKYIRKAELSWCFQGA